jgi:spore coat polysaccharide biosynthesis protein SpsF
VKTVFLIIGRLKSTRLQMKLLREVCGRPILSHMIDRLKLTKRVDEIAICTSTNPQDDPLVEIASQSGVKCFRGDEDDVIKRLADAASQFQADYVLNITADCPFADPIYAEKIIDALETTGADMVRALDLPHGAFSYGNRVSAFHKIMEIKDDRDTETWGRYFTDTDLFAVYDLPIENPRHRRPELRMTLDYPEDLEFFRAVFDHLGCDRVFSLDEILDLLDRHPEIVEINRHCEALYLKRWTRQSSIKLKPRYSVKTAAIIGCGSIGRRHIQNLQQLGINQITALRTRLNAPLDQPTPAAVIEVEDWNELAEAKPDVAIISNPTSLHLEAALKLLPFVRAVFIEKPLAASLDRVEAFLHELKQRRIVSFVGHNLQFHPAVLMLQKFLDRDDVGQPVVLQCQVGQWIEDWHPGRDYRNEYCARKELGGGVTLSLIHEIHLAQELLGPAKRVYCVMPKSDKLDLDVDTTANFTIEHAGGAISQIHLDLLQRPAQRRGVLSLERGWIDYDLMRNQVSAQVAGGDRTVIWDKPDFETNEPYVSEMATFLDYAKQGRVRHEHDAWRAAQSLATAVAGFESAASGCAVNVKKLG